MERPERQRGWGDGTGGADGIKGGSEERGGCSGDGAIGLGKGAGTSARDDGVRGDDGPGAGNESGIGWVVAEEEAERIGKLGEMAREGEEEFEGMEESKLG